MKKVNLSNSFVNRLWLLLGLSLLFSSASFTQSTVTNRVREYRRANEHRLLNEFADLLAIPNVASDTPNIRKNADYLVAQMRTRGLKPRLLEAADSTVPPVVYGEWLTPGVAKTIILYAHYDGQHRPIRRRGRAASRGIR